MDKQLLSQTISRHIPGSLQKFTSLLGWGSSHYWVGVVLVVRCLHYVVFAFNVLGDPSVNLLFISASMLGLAIIVRFMGKIWYLDILEASFFLNLGILASGTLYKVMVTYMEL